MQVVVPDEFRYLYVLDERRPVVKVPAEVLRTPARQIANLTNKHRLIAENMLRVMRKAHGIGLAGPQLGISERVIVMAPHGRVAVMFNPEIVSHDGEVTAEEGCLSIPGLYGDVSRPATVEVKALDRKGRESLYVLEGLAARVVQHEIDHLDGVLFIDRADPATLHWQHPYHEDEDRE